MPLTNRILPAAPFPTLDDYLAAGGGRALEAARRVEPEALIGEIEASGLRGRGGAGFPTATKWRTVAANASPELPTTVVVNAAEGEPGTYKDRTILRLDPYAVLEGALVALYAVGAGDVVVALKAREPVERERVERAIDEMAKADLLDGVDGVGRDGAARVPVRRGDRPARGGRRAAAAAPHRPALPPRRGRGGRARRRRRPRAAGSPPTSRWPAPTRRPWRRRRSSTTSRPSPTWPTSSPKAPRGSASWAPRRPRARSCARSRATWCGPAWARSRSARACAPRSTSWPGVPTPSNPVKAVLNGVSGAPLPAALLDTPAHLRGHGGRRQRPRHRQPRSSSARAPTWWRWPPAPPGSWPSSRAGSARPARPTA